MHETEPIVEEEIGFLDYWQVVRKRGTLIGLIVLIGVLITIAYSLSLTNIYRANVTITPINEKNGGGRGGGLSALVQQVGDLPGISLPTSSSATEIVNLLEAKILRKKVIEKYKLFPVLFSERWDSEKKDWRTEDDKPTLWDGIRKLDEMVKVRDNSKENTITISVDYYDADMATKIADYLLTALNEHMSNESKRVAETNRKYLETQLNNTSDPLIRQKIYNLIAQQIETEMMAGLKENFAFKVVDPPMVPDRKIRPNRRRMVMLNFVVLLIGGIFFSFLLEYVEKGRSSEKKNV